MIGERAAGQGPKERRRRDGGGRRMKDGMGRKEEHAPTQVCSLLSAGWIACHQPPAQLIRVKAEEKEQQQEEKMRLKKIGMFSHLLYSCRER